MIPRGSNQSKTKAKQEAFKFILKFAQRPSVESFTIADIKPLLDAPNMGSAYLRELVDSNILVMRQSSQGELHFSRKPTDILRKTWRKRSCSEIGIRDVIIGGNGR